MPNVYARLPDLQNDSNATATANAAALLRNLIAASAEVEDRALRQFSARLVTAYLDVPAPNRANNFGQRLWLPFDVASITTLKEKTADPLTYGTTLTENTHFLTYREDGDSNRPMVYLDRLDGGTWSEGANKLQLVGYRGYSYEVDDTGLVVADNPLTNSATSLTVSASATLAAGMMLKIESEQCYISAIPDSTHATIERAQNGTTAVQHAQNVAISVRRYPREIEEATKLRAIDYFIAKRNGSQGVSGGEDAGFSSSSVYRQFVGLLGPMRRLDVP